MSFWSKMKKMPSELPHGTAHRGFGGFLVDKAERVGASYAFGVLKGHRQYAMVRGMPTEAVAGVGLWLATVALHAFSGGRSHLADHLERFGDAGVMGWANTMGASKGATLAGRTVMSLPSGKTAGLPAGRASVVGMVPPLASGASFLSADRVRDIAARR